MTRKHETSPSAPPPTSELTARARSSWGAAGLEAWIAPWGEDETSEQSFLALGATNPGTAPVPRCPTLDELDRAPLDWRHRR